MSTCDDVTSGCECDVTGTDQQLACPPGYACSSSETMGNCQPDSDFNSGCCVPMKKASCKYCSADTNCNPDEACFTSNGYTSVDDCSTRSSACNISTLHGCCGQPGQGVRKEVSTYSCQAGVCKPDPNSTLSLEQCQATGCKYQCDPISRQCVWNPNPYAASVEDYATCMATGCQYVCDEANRQCVRNKAGIQTLDECTTAGCPVKHRCNGTKCVPDPTGTQTKAECEAFSCPVRYKCSNTGTTYNDYSCVQAGKNEAGPFVSAQECKSTCPVEYSCDGDICNPTPGSRLTEFECKQQCPWKYNCDNGECVQSPTGQSTLEACQYDCYKYTCDAATKQCVQAPRTQITGPDYATAAACIVNSQCTPWGCNSLTQQCVQTPAGTYENLAVCSAACSNYVPPVSVCPDGNQCHAIGMMVVPTDTDLQNPFKMRPFYDTRTLNSGCVVAEVSDQGQMDTETYTNTAKFMEKVSTDTSVTASGSGGGWSASTTVDVKTNSMSEQDSFLQGTVLHVANPRGVIKWSSRGTCNELSNLDDRVVHALLRLPLLTTIDWTQPLSTSQWQSLLPYQEFMQYVGTYVVQQIVVGTDLRSSATLSNQSSSKLKELGVSACVSGGYGGFSASACSDYKSSDIKTASELNISNTSVALGGDPNIRAIVSNSMHKPTSDELALFSAATRGRSFDQPLSYKYSPIWDAVQIVRKKDGTPINALYVDIDKRLKNMKNAFYTAYAITHMAVISEKEVTTSKEYATYSIVPNVSTDILSTGDHNFAVPPSAPKYKRVYYDGWVNDRLDRQSKYSGNLNIGEKVLTRRGIVIDYSYIHSPIYIAVKFQPVCFLSETHILTSLSTRKGATSGCDSSKYVAQKPFATCTQRTLIYAGIYHVKYYPHSFLF